jgi:hypothetical protein
MPGFTNAGHDNAPCRTKNDIHRRAKICAQPGAECAQGGGFRRQDVTGNVEIAGHPGLHQRQRRGLAGIHDQAMTRLEAPVNLTPVDGW